MSKDLADDFVTLWENSGLGEGIPLEREYRFAAHHVGLGPGIRDRLKQAGLRDWHFDVAFPDRKVACEINGGIYTKGRHVRPKGYLNDCAKIRDAGKLGWRVLPFPAPLLNTEPSTCINDLACALDVSSPD